MNINYAPVRYKSITAALFNVVSGVAGYIDTNVSATTGTDTSKAWLINSHADGGSGLLGARTLGDTADPKTTGNDGTFIAYVSATGHLDLYRVAGGDNKYYLIGYLQ